MCPTLLAVSPQTVHFTPRTLSAYRQAQVNCPRRPYRRYRTIFGRIDTRTIPSTLLEFGFTVRVMAIYIPYSSRRYTAVCRIWYGVQPYFTDFTVSCPANTPMRICLLDTFLSNLILAAIPLVQNEGPTTFSLGPLLRAGLKTPKSHGSIGFSSWLLHAAYHTAHH